MIAPCTARVPVARLPSRVAIIRQGRTVGTPGLSLQAGDQIRVRGGASFTLRYAGNSYSLSGALAQLECRRVLLKPRRGRPAVLAVVLQFGRVRVRSGSHAGRALLISHEMLAFATAPGTTYIVQRSQAAGATRAWTRNGIIVAARASDQTLRLNARLTYTAIADTNGLRLDVWPFSISALQRPTTPADRLPAYWADGLPCSAGCTAPGAIPGWPLKPFHEQHAIRAGINELRPANFHVAVDIEARNFQPVYAIQSGYATIRYPGTGDVNVDVGNFYYWHIKPTVSNGEFVTAYKTVIGRVLFGFYHMAAIGGEHLRLPQSPAAGRQPHPVHQHRASGHWCASESSRTGAWKWAPSARRAHRPGAPL